MKMKRSLITLMMAASVGISAPLMADNHGIDSAYEEGKAHQEAMKKLRQQLEMLELKDKMATHIYSCQQKGVKCNLNMGEDAPVKYVGIENAAKPDQPEGVQQSQGMSEMMIRLKPGDPDYIPPVDEEMYSPPMMEEPVMPEEVEAEPVDLEMYIDPEFEEEMPPMYEAPAMAPELLGIENDEALFLVNGQQVRVKGGYMVGDTGWKVRDVSFEKVWVKRPDGESEYLYLNWK